jgi:hypothetical protein
MHRTAASQHDAAQDQNDVNHALVSDLVSLIEDVQNSLRLIEQTIARETSLGSAKSSTDVIVLDDVSPIPRSLAALPVSVHRLFGF